MTRILRTLIPLIAVLLLASCAFGEGAVTSTSAAVSMTTAAPTSAAAPASTAAPAGSTTTVSASTTTEVPSTDIWIEVAVYDAWYKQTGAWTDYCLTREEFNGVDFTWVGYRRNVLLTDASSDEVLAVALLGPGQVQADGEGYEYCLFRGLFAEVPLDRPLYAYTLEGDHWGGVVTVDAAELKDRTLGMLYYEPAEQQKREEAGDS